IVDLVAANLNLDPAHVRRKNFIPPDKFPYTSAEGLAYDSGNYGPALDKALAAVDYRRLREEQKRGPRNGKHLGIGLSTYVEICGLGPSSVVGSTGFQGGLWESAVVRLHPTAKATVFTGTSPHGQGEETTFAQVVAAVPGLEPPAGGRAGPGGLRVLRSHELHVPLRLARRRRGGGRRDGTGGAQAVRRRRRLRPGHQPPDRRRSGARGARSGHRAGAVRGRGV